MLVTFSICFKHFDTRHLVFYNPSPPRMFLSLDLLSEYRIQHCAIGPFYVTSRYSSWIFCWGVSGFATNCPCDVWCRGLTTCLLHAGPPFGNRYLNTSWAVGLTYWIVYLHFFVFWHMQLYMLDTSYHFWLYLFSSTLVLTSSIDVVFVLSITMYCPWNYGTAPAKSMLSMSSAYISATALLTQTSPDIVHDIKMNVCQWATDWRNLDI